MRRGPRPRARSGPGRSRHDRSALSTDRQNPSNARLREATLTDTRSRSSPLAAQAGDLPQASVTTQLSRPAITSGSRSEREEHVGSKHAPDRMLPTRESLNRHELGRSHVDDGLVEHAHLRALDRVLQINLELNVRTTASVGHAVQLVRVATEGLWRGTSQRLHSRGARRRSRRAQERPQPRWSPTRSRRCRRACKGA